MSKPFDDEICECGHSKGYHKANPEDINVMQSMDEHGGECDIEDCECKRYTWSKFVKYVEWRT